MDDTKMKQLLFLTLAVSCLTFVAACSKTTAPLEKTPTPIIAATSLQTPSLPITQISTLTRTPHPTLTPSPTTSPTPSSTPMPTKQIVLVYYQSVGDGGGYTLYDRFVNTSSCCLMPRLVLYADGHLLMREKFVDFDAGYGYETGRYIEYQLSMTELCDLYLQLEKLGMFANIEPVLISTPQPGYEFAESAGSYILAVSGDPPAHRSRAVVGGGAQYSPEYFAPLDFIENYHPKISYLYKPNRIALWIEKLQLTHSVSEEKLEYPSWPDDGVPSLAELLDMKTKGSALIEGEQAFNLFDYEGEYMKYHSSINVFHEGEMDYVVLSRPLLPHETIGELIQDSLQVEPAPYSELPFRCEK